MSEYLSTDIFGPDETQLSITSWVLAISRIILVYLNSHCGKVYFLSSEIGFLL